MRSLLLALAAVAAATVPAAAQEKLKPKKAKIAKIAILEVTPAPPPHQADNTVGLIVPEPLLPPAITIVVPEPQFADARPYPLGMMLVEVPRVTRLRITIVEPETPEDPPWAFVGAGVAALGALVFVRRRGPLAHAIGTL